jgi:general secretion pathway protein D
MTRCRAGCVGTALITARRIALAMAIETVGLAPALGAQDTTAVRVTDRGVLVDFQDADLRFVISALAEAGGLNVSYADLPARRVTLRMRQPVARENVGALLKSLAESNGLLVHDEAGVIRVDVSDAPRRSATESQAKSGQTDPKLFVYRLRHAQAVRLASTLQAIFGSRQTGANANTAQRPTSLTQQLRDQRVPPVSRDTARTPDRAIPVLATLGAQLAGEIQIVPDEATNSLLVRAQPDDWTIVQQAVAALDLRPLQVVIEVLIAEVRQTRDLTLSLSGSASHTRPGDTAPASSASLSGITTGDFITKLTSGGSINVDVALTALSSHGDVRVLSRPILLAQNNQEAKMLVGSQRPFVQVFRSLPTDGAVRDQVVQYRDVGTSLTILPTINPDDYVSLQVAQEVSTATSELQFGAPVISTRETTTHLFVKDGQTAVLGGLVDRQMDKSRSGIPWLSDIPLIGWLFGTHKTSTTTSELFLFLTPHLVRTDEELDQIRERIEKQAPLLRENGAMPESKLNPDKPVPAAPVPPPKKP